MEILNKKTKLILAILIIAALIGTAVSYAILSGNNVANASNGEMAQYANAKIGDIVTYGNYYQDTNGTTKTPIEWLVVDKNEKTGELTLLAKHVMAGGSFWGNWFYDNSNSGGFHSPNVGVGPAGSGCNQNWADSTLRAWLNNLERTDVHGDKFKANGIQLYADKVTPSKAVSIGANNTVNFAYQHSDLKYNIGYSNKNHWTNLTTADITGNLPTGYYKRTENNEIYYKRPNITERPAVNGFLDEAFTKDEQARIIPRVIAGQNSHQWPSSGYFMDDKVITPTTVDKIWVPSAAELNIEVGVDWNGQPDDGNGNNNWFVGSDNSTSDAFAFFRQFKTIETLSSAVRATGTEFDKNPQVSNYSIPLDVPTSNIGTANSQNEELRIDYWGNKGTREYWTRTATSYWSVSVGFIMTSGGFYSSSTYNSGIGARPAMILSYR